MKFTCSNEVWSKGIGAVHNAVGSPISNSMVENIFVECTKSSVVFMATNLNLTIRCECEVSVEEEGQIALPNKVIGDIVRDLPAGDVAFTCKDTSVEIVSGSFKAKLMGQAGDQFPPFIEIDDGIDLNVEAEELKQAIRWTIFSTTTEKSRFELDGLKWVLGKEGIKIVATDGRRLASLDRAWNCSDEANCLIPSKTMSEALNSLPDTGAVSIRVSERKVTLEAAGIGMASNLLVDNFPPFERIIPKENLVTAEIPREEFLGAIRRAASLASLETNMITLELEKGKLYLLGERQEIGGVGSDEIEIAYEGDNIKVFYNHKFLSDVLKVLDSEKVLLELWDATRPGVIRPAGDESYLYVIMPMRPPEEESPPDAE